MATKFFAAQTLEDMIVLAKNNLRDLRSKKLKPFYAPLDPIPAQEVADRARESAEFRQSKGLPSVSSTETAAQIATPKSEQAFRRTVTNAGLEVSFTEDLVALDGSAAIPQLGYRTEFVAEKTASGAQVSTAEIRARLSEVAALKAQLPSVERTLHVVETGTAAVVDEDPRVAQAVRAMQDYIRKYLRSS